MLNVISWSVKFSPESALSLYSFLVILLLFGAKRLPELARGLGKGINEFKDAAETGKKEILDAEKRTENKNKS